MGSRGNRQQEQRPGKRAKKGLPAVCVAGAGREGGRRQRRGAGSIEGAELREPGWLLKGKCMLVYLHFITL